jgi:hypothetical protein
MTFYKSNIIFEQHQKLLLPDQNVQKQFAARVENYD